MVKMKSVSKITILGLKMMVKICLEKIVFYLFLREEGDFCYWICYVGQKISLLFIKNAGK